MSKSELVTLVKKQHIQSQKLKQQITGKSIVFFLILESLTCEYITFEYSINCLISPIKKIINPFVKIFNEKLNSFQESNNWK